MNATAILRLIQDASGIKGPEEFCCFGDALKEVNAVMVCWMATSEAIQHAVEVEADLIICHEAFFLPYLVEYSEGMGDFLSFPVNYKRTAALAKHGISIIRVHPSMDKISILDTAAQILKLENLVADDGEWARVYQLNEPVSFTDLIEHVEKCGLPVLRYSDADPERIISRIGIPWGGMSLFVNIPYMQQLVNMGCDAFIAGESDSYTFHFVKESGIAMIETGHEASENAGVGLFADWLRDRLENTRVEYFESRPAYIIRNQ